jgi:hypothetical protein
MGIVEEEADESIYWMELFVDSRSVSSLISPPNRAIFFFDGLVPR